MITRAKKVIAILLAVAFMLPLLVSPAAAAPVAGDPLGYFVYHMEKEGQFYFLVTNPSNQVVKLNFKTEREFELVVRKGNQVVWKYSDTKEWDKTPKEENFLPGHAKLYKVDVPKLPAGNYTLNAFFAGGPSQGQRVAQTQFTIGGRGWQPPVENSKALSYRLFQVDNELMLITQNTSSKPVQLRFPSAKEFDIVVYNSSWNKVWQDSWNHRYAQRAKTETLAPGQAKVYRTKLPKLADGRYYAYAYFYGTPGNKAVASLNFSLNSKNWGGDNGGINWDIANKLTFSAWYNGGKQPQIAFEVKNKTKNPVKISYPMSKAIRVVVKGNNGYTWQYNTNPAVNTTTTIAGGGASYSFVYLPNLPKGNYTAEVYYEAYSKSRPAATTSFRVW